MERAPAAGAGFILDIDDLLDPLEMRRKRSTVRLAPALGRNAARLCFACSLRLSKRSLGILEAQLELIDIELLGTPAEPVALEGFDDCLQALNLGIGALQLPGLLEDECAQRIHVVGKIGLAQHQGPLNQPSESTSTSDLRCLRTAPAVYPAPVQALQEHSESRCAAPPFVFFGA